MVKLPDSGVQGGKRPPEEIAREITQLAGSGNFSEAEELRDLLLAEHPMALSEIVSTGELIEKEKEARLDKAHIALWSELYDQLSQEERNCLFYSTKAAKITQGRLLFTQGKRNSKLFFINSGRVTLFHKKGEARHLIGQLSRGDIVGEEVLLDISYATYSAGCQTDVELRYLEKSVAAGWEKEFPGLEQKLSDYCLRHGRAEQLMKEKLVEKREFDRYPFDVRVSVHILDGEKKRTGKGVKGIMNDFSRAGLNFAVRLSKKETAHALLGRLVEVELESTNTPVYLVGKIVRIGFHLHNDYSVHVMLDRVLPEDVLQKIIKSR